VKKIGELAVADPKRTRRSDFLDEGNLVLNQEKQKGDRGVKYRETDTG